MNFTFITLFPELFDAPMSTSIVGRAVSQGAVGWSTVSPRDFATDRHRTTDDTPYGGGAGMVMRAPELAASVRWARSQAPAARVVLMSPQGPRFDQRHARRLAQERALILVCGRYEGIDERFVDACVDLELSIGDFVLTGGEPAAVCVVDAVVRLLPGVLGNADSPVEESFSSPSLEHPQFTRPIEWEGRVVPSVLRSGDHARVARWRQRVAAERTRRRRPDLSSPGLGPRARVGDARDPVEPWLVVPRGLDRDPEE